MTAQPELQPATEYYIPEAYSRGYGQPLTDIRARGYFYGVGSLSAGLIALGTTVFFVGLGGLSVLPGIMAIYLGVLAIKNAAVPRPTPFTSKAKNMGIWGIVCGVLAILMVLGGVALFALLGSSMTY